MQDCTGWMAGCSDNDRQRAVGGLCGLSWAAQRVCWESFKAMNVFNAAQVEQPIWPELKEEPWIVLACASLLNGQLCFRNGKGHWL
jgi:hypothetical protein